MKTLIAFLKWLAGVFFRIEIRNSENIPLDGACIVCLNHISLFDPVIAYCYLPRKIRFIGKSELMKIPVVGSILKSMGVIPVKRGTGDIGAVKASLKTLKDGEVLGIFPTGTREKKNPNAPVKPGVALIASKSASPIIPVHINATYKLFSKVVLTVGKPVDFTNYSGKKLTQEELTEAAEKIYVAINSMGDAR